MSKSGYFLQYIMVELMSHSVSLTSPLAQLKVLSNVVDNDRLGRYLDHELNGYPIHQDVPIYRQFYPQVALETFIHGTIVQADIFEYCELQPNDYTIAPKIFIQEGLKELKQIRCVNRQINDAYTKHHIDTYFQVCLPECKEYQVLRVIFHCDEKRILKINSSIRTILLNLCMKLSFELGIESSLNNLIRESEKVNKIIDRFFDGFYNMWHMKSQ